MRGKNQSFDSIIYLNLTMLQFFYQKRANPFPHNKSITIFIYDGGR